MKLDIGSGHIYREGFKRVDIDPDVNAHFKCLAEDIEGEIAKETVDEIYSAHCLEHIQYSKCFKTLRAFWRILKPGGKITLIVPDADSAIRDYSRWKNFNEFEKTILGSDPDATEWMTHRNIFNYDKLRRYLIISGFTNIFDDLTPELNIITIKANKPEEDVDE